MIYYINEYIFRKNKNDIPQDEKEKIINKYKNKTKIPNYSTIDKAAYILCKYKPSDMDKFCNSSDTTRVKQDLSNKVKLVNKYNPKDISKAQELLNSISDSSMVILTGKSLKDDAFIYNKDNGKLYIPNSDRAMYTITSWSFFLDQVKGDLKNKDGYDI